MVPVKAWSRDAVHVDILPCQKSGLNRTYVGDTDAVQVLLSPQETLEKWFSLDLKTCFVDLTLSMRSCIFDQRCMETKFIVVI